MYTILIVDDEEAVHQVIWKLVNPDEKPMFRVLDAYNGEQALRLFEETEIDLLFVDIRMPGMTGLELMEQLQGNGCMPLTVVISGYDDFEYMQFAIRINVYDYLLKPLDRHEFRRCLDRLWEELERKRNGSSGEKADMYPDKKKILKKVLYEEKQEPSAADGRYRAILPEEKSYRIVLINILNFHNIYQDSFEGEINKAFDFVCNHVKEEFSEFTACYAFRDQTMRNTITVIIEYESEVLIDRLPYVLSRAVRKLYEKLKAKTCVVVGEQQKEAGFLKKAYKSVRKFLYQTDLFETKTSQIYWMEQEDIRENFSVPSVNLPLLLNVFQTQNYNLSEQMVREYLGKILQEYYYSRDIAKRILIQWISALECVQYQLKTVFLNQSYEMLADELEKRGYDLDVLSEQITEMVKKLMVQYENAVKDNRKNIPEAIKDYIDSYYHTKINLATFTEQFFLDKDYLTKMFKKEFGSGITEYLFQVRMKHALELLLTTDLTIKAVGELVGFRDNNYFSKAFRNYYGYSPKDVRRGK